MRALMLLLILLIPIAVAAQELNNDEGAPATVVSFKWYKDRRSADTVDTASSNTPVPAMIAANKNFEKQRRVNDPAGVRDPNQDTLDGRSAALDRIVQESRDAKPPVDGFTYQAQIRNKSTKAIKIVFWEYQFREAANTANVSRRQFVCFVKVKPDKTRDLEIFTLTAPTGVVSVESLKKKTAREFKEDVIINRVEYDDGSTWQRKGWNFEDVKLTSPRSDSQKIQACRGL